MVSMRTGAEQAEQGAPLSRVTLVGERRRIGLALPAREPIGVLLPEIVRLLGDRPDPGTPSRRLVTEAGAVLSPDDSLASAEVPDGAVLRLVREPGGPAAPDAPGPADEAAEDFEVRGWRWGDRSRTWTAGAASVLLALIAGVSAGSWYGPDRAAGWLGAVAVCAAAAGVAAGRRGRRAPGAALLLWGGTLGVLAAWQATTDGAVRPAAVGLTVAAALALLGLGTELGRGGLIGAAVVALGVGAWEAGLALTSVPRTGVALGLVSVLVLGWLPRLALRGAGLTRLDDRRSGGTPVSRHRVATALGATHRGLALATVTMAVSAGTAGVLAAGSQDGWSVAAAVLLCVVLCSRSRAYPLAVEVIALLAAGTAVAVCLVVRWAAGADNPAGALAALCVLAVLPLVALMVRVPEHVRVRLRRLTNLVESTGVVALIPVALGAFGVYSRLPHMF
ncbi:EsaB/YukD family protein [Streptomyces celluloflavus]